jgi:hypothetical protein
VNLCLQEDLIRKPTRWTYSSAQITFIRDETDIEDSRTIQKATHRRTSQVTDRGADLPVGPTCQALLATSVLHRLKDHIYVVALSRFDPRVQNWCYPLYIAAPTKCTANMLLKLYIIFSSILTTSNVKPQNYKVLELIGSYNFDMKSIFIWPHTKKILFF